MNDDDNHIEISYEGEISFNDDETAISGISPRGWLKYRNNGARILAGVNDNGLVQYELYQDGRMVDPGSEEGKRLLAKSIRRMINLGFDIEGRLERLYRKGGYRALLDATDSLDGDYVKGRYLERILDADSVPADMMVAVITRIRERLGSDYDKERLLTKVDTSYLKNDSVSRGYLQAVKSIGSDYEKSVALRKYIGMGQALSEGAPFDSLLTVIDGVNGDYEKGNLLKQIIHKDIRRDQSWAGLIRLTSQMAGDYDKSNLLVEMAPKLPRTDSLKAMYMTAARTVHSDVDYGRVVRAVN